MKPIGLALGALMFAAPLPAAAQDIAPAESGALADLQATLADPAKQQEIAATVRVLGEVFLDMPLAPLADAVERVTGETMADVTPNTTLRSVLPEASRVPEELERQTPQAMEAMGAMTDALEAMLPALRDMADRLEEALPPDT